MAQIALHEGSRKVVLLVDSDGEVRSELCAALTKEGFAVKEAKDGRLALAMLKKEKPHVILADFNLPHLDGLSLFEHVRSFSKIPFVLMTNFDAGLNTEEAHRRGVTDFVVKPVKIEEVIAALDVAMNASTEVKENTLSEQEDIDLDYCRLSIEEFVSGKISLADIFVRVSSNKYIQVARQNSELSIDRINAYKNKGLQFLYIRKQDFARYIGLNMGLTKRVGKAGVSKSQRLRLMKHTGEILLQDAYVNGVDKTKLQSSIALVEAMVSTLSEDKDLFELIQILQTHADHLYAHSLGVALYSSMVAKEVGWQGTPTLFKVTMGGLLHDIGKKEIQRAILEKPRQLLTADERELYETHPIRGKEILGLVRSVPDDVAQIAMHHHENQAGRGFPYRLLKSKIHPLAKLVAVVNQFCELVLKAPNTRDPISAFEALDRMYSLKQQELDLSFLRALMALFFFKPPADMPQSTLPTLNWNG